MSKKKDKYNFGTLLLETPASKKGMSFLGNWQDRYLRLFDSSNGLVLAYYKNKDTPKPKGHLTIKPHGKVHEIDTPGSPSKRQNILSIAAVDGRSFTCSMPDPDTRTQWADVIREECDNATDKGRRLSQSMVKMSKERMGQLTVKVVSHMRYKKHPSAAISKSLSRKGSTARFMQEQTFGYDFGIFNFQAGKWSKLWSKTMTDKEWQQAHEMIRKSGLLNIFGSKSVALKYPESYGKKGLSISQRLETRALDIELVLHCIFNLVDMNAIKANAAPWVCAIAFPALHRALQMPASVAAQLCRLGYKRKCLVFGEDPEHEVTGVVNDFDMDDDVVDFQLNPVSPMAPERSEAALGIRKSSSMHQKYKINRTKSKLTFKPVVVYSGVLWKKPTSGGLGKGRKRWFSLRRTEIGDTAVLEYFEDPHEKSLKGSMALNYDSCDLLLGTDYCRSGRWRFCIKSGSKAIEAEAGSEKEFGTWVMHILRYTYNQNSLNAVSPRPAFDSDSFQSKSQILASPAEAAAVSSSSSSIMAPRQTPTHAERVAIESKNEGNPNGAESGSITKEVYDAL